jgi:hypothetical protein
MTLLIFKGSKKGNGLREWAMSNDSVTYFIQKYCLHAITLATTKWWMISSYTPCISSLGEIGLEPWRYDKGPQGTQLP